MIRILIADDHLLIRQGMRLILETEDGLELVGEALNGAEAVRLCAELNPDVVLMDLRMPTMDGLTMAEKIRTDMGNKTVHIIMLTTEDNPVMRERGRAIGVTGWIVKPFRGEAVLGPFRKLCGLSA